MGQFKFLKLNLTKCFLVISVEAFKSILKGVINLDSRGVGNINQQS